MAELVALFVKYPQWVGEQAVIEAKRESPIYVPSVPLVERECEKAVGQTRQALTYAQNWERQSQLQLEERRQIETAEKEESLEYRREVVARVWPSGLTPQRSTTRDIGTIQNPPKDEFRQFSEKDLRKIYPPKAEAAE